MPRDAAPRSGPVLTITLGDLRQRRRQFVIAALGASVVFGIALVMSGMSQSFRSEIDRTLDGIGADRYVVATGTAGPLTAVAAIPTALADDLARAPGAERVDPLIVVPQSVEVDGEFTGINLVAHRFGRMGTPPLAAGRAAEADGEAVADVSLGTSLGDDILLSGRPVTVVGHTRGHTLLAGVPNLYVSLAAGQALAFDGRELASTFAVQGPLDEADVPAGLRLVSKAEARRDALRAMGDAIDSVDSSRLLMWGVAAVIMAGLVYVSALERGREFAVLKAMGASTRDLFVSVALQAVLISLVAVAVSTILARLLAPAFALDVAVPAHAYRDLPLVALVVGLLASVAGLRRAATADPALAFGGE